MNISKKVIIEDFSIYKLGLLNFYLGIFFLSSALPISGIFLLIALLISIYINKNSYFKDKWNWPFIFTLILMFISCTRNYFFNQSEIKELTNLSYIWLDLLNWLIFFIIFWGFQIYLKTSKDRYRFSQVLIASLFPVLISCALQSWFKVFGPFEIFNGLIVWFQRPLGTWDFRVTGLFNNPNYTGIWLAISWPFIFLSIKNNRKSKAKTIFLWILLILTSYFILKAGSRNAVISLLISSSFFMSSKTFIYFFIFLASYILISNLLNIYTFSIFGNESIIKKIRDFNEKLISLNLVNFKNSVRMNLWKNTLNLISRSPLFGYGASTFAIIYQLQIKDKIKDWNPQHAHNMTLQLAFNYGWMVSLFLSFTILAIFVVTYRKIFMHTINNDNLYVDKIWFSASFICLLSNIGDINYFDGKISIIICILISGLKCILEEKSIFPKKSNKYFTS